MNALASISQSLPADFLYYAILFLIFFAVVSLVIGVFYLVYGRKRLTDRLDTLLKPQQPPAEQAAVKSSLVSEEPQGLSAKISKQFLRLDASNLSAKNTPTRVRLLQAGLRSRKAYFNFFASKVIGALLLPSAFVVSMFFFKVTPARMLMLVVLALLGYFLPNLVLFLMTRKRQDELRRALPDALDLMVVCVEAGLGLDMTFKRVGEEMRGISRELSDEFMLTTLEVRSGLSRQESFKNMALRAGVPEINQLMTMLNQTSRFGTSLATALRVHSDAMRIKRRQTAEEIAAKAAIKLLFPLVMFIFPTLFIVLLGPAAIRIMRVMFPALGGG